MAYSFLEELTINPTIEPQNLHSTLGGHKQKLVCTRTQEKGTVTPQETDPDLPVSVQESPAEAWVGGGLLQSWGHLRALSVAVCTGENLKEVTIIFITSTIV